MSTIESSEFVTLASNGCLDHFPNNSLTRFTNVLPYAITDKNNIRLFARLRSIAISTILEDPNQEIEYVKIKLGELQPSINNDKYDKCLARIDFPPKSISGSYGIEEFKYSSFQPLKTLPLHQLTVLITDSKNNQLRLAHGVTTFVTIEISNMDFSRQFPVTCLSNDPDAQNYFISNVYTDFRCKLPQTLDLDGWEVALSSVIYPKRLRSRCEIAFRLSWTTAPRDEDDEYTVAVDVMDLTSMDEVMTEINYNIAQHPVWRNKVVFERDGIGRYQFTLDHVELNGRFMTIQVGSRLAKLFGVTEHPDYQGFTGSNTFVNPPDLNRIKPSTIGMVYCDIVETSAVGGSLCPLLHLMPLENYVQSPDPRTTSIYAPQHLIFYPVINRQFSTIRFQIREPDGTPHDFGERVPDDPGLAITLLFRPINTSQRRTSSVFD